MMPDEADRGEQVYLKLTPMQKEAAKICGVSNKDYAQHLLRLVDEILEELKCSPNHGGKRYER